MAPFYAQEVNFLGSFYGPNGMFWGQPALHRSNIFGLITIYRSIFGSVCALQVKFLGPVYVLQIKFFGVCLRCTGLRWACYSLQALLSVFYRSNLESVYALLVKLLGHSMVHMPCFGVTLRSTGQNFGSVYASQSNV